MDQPEKSFEKNILKWLQRHGYPLEMRVARAFKQEGFDIAQGRLYTDAETGKQREMDVIASRMRLFEGSFISVRFVIECKSTKSKPWLMFTVPWSDLEKGLPHGQFVTELDPINLWTVFGKEWTGDCRLLKPARRFAYGLTETMREEPNARDRAYDAAQAVSKCALEALRLDKQLFQTHRNIATNLVMPVILIDGRLFDCYLGSTDEPVIDEVERGVLAWGRSIAGHSDMLIRVETITGLAEFVSAAREFTDMILTREDLLRGLMTSELTLKSKDSVGPGGPSE